MRLKDELQEVETVSQRRYHSCLVLVSVLLKEEMVEVYTIRLYMQNFPDVCKQYQLLYCKCHGNFVKGVHTTQFTVCEF